MSDQEFYRWQGDDLILKVFVQPKASKNEFCEVRQTELDSAIKIRISAPPVDGKANQQVVQFLSKVFQVSKSQVTLLTGETSRQKRFCIKSPKKLPAIISSMKKL